MIKTLVASTLIAVTLSGCSPMSVLTSFLPNKPSVSLDTQIGKENTQQNAVIASSGDKDSINAEQVNKEDTGVVVGQVKENKVVTDKIDTSVIAEKQTTIQAENSSVEIENNSTNIPPWVLLLLLLGWILPTPNSIFKSIVKWKKKNEGC